MPHFWIRLGWGKKNFGNVLTQLPQRERVLPMNETTQETQVTEVTQPRRRRVNLSLSAATHQRVRVYCAKRGVSMQAELERLLDAAFKVVDTGGGA
jgi:hypothetical protein